MNALTKNFTAVVFLALVFATELFASEPLSYTGRLVNTNGAPVTGPVNLNVALAYTNNLSSSICAASFPAVPLNNGVFHLKIEYSLSECSGKTMSQVMSSVPAGETVALRVTDTTHSKTYPFHAIHYLPMSVLSAVARTLVAPPSGTPSGHVLSWNGTAWVPVAAGGGGSGSITTINTGTGLSGGTITSTGTISIAAGGVSETQLAANAVTDAKVSAGAAIARSKLASGTANHVLINDAGGVMSSVSALPLLLGGTGASTASAARANLGLGTSAVANIGFSAGQVLPADSITPCLPGFKLNITTLPTQTWTCTAEDQDGTKLPLAGGTMSGVIDMGSQKITNLATPTNSADAATKAYVDGLLPGASIWSQTGSDIYRSTGKVGIGLSSPNAILDVASTTSGILVPRMTEVQRNAIAAPLAGMVLYNTTSNKLNFYDTAWRELGVSGSGLQSLSLGAGFTASGAVSSGDTISVNTGTSANEIVQLNGSAQLPAVSGSLLTNLNPANLSTVVPATKGGTGLATLGTSNQLLGMNNAAGGMEYKSLAAGAGISITHAANLVTITSSGATPTGAASGDLSGSFPSPTVSKLQGTDLSLTAPTSGQVLLYNGSSYAPTTISGDASVSSAGALTLGTVPVSKGGTGATSLTAKGIVTVNDSANGLVAVNCTNNQFLRFNASGNAVCSDVTTITSNSFTQSGNSFGATAVLGTNDAFGLEFETNGTARMNILAGGNVGIGTNSPGSKLDVKGELRLSGATSGFVGFTPPTVAGSTTYTLPNADGTSGQVLTTNGSGVLSWTAGGGGSTSVGGDLSGTLSNAQIATGAVSSTEIADASIVDADVSSGAAIARSKLATGTADHVVINNGSGVLSSIAALSPSMGGTGLSSFTASKLYVSNASGTALEILNCLPFTYVSFDVTGAPVCSSLPVAASGVSGIVSNSAQTFSGTKTFENGVQVGSAVTICDSSTEGTIRYNSTSKKMEFCNATSWANFSSGSGSSDNDPCGISPSPGAGCRGGAIFLGTLAGNKYMTTPGGCGEIPAGQYVYAGWGDSHAYPSADFIPTCSGGADTLMKSWSQPLYAPWFFIDIPELTNYESSDLDDVNLGSTNTTIIAAITDEVKGGHHPAALYCDRLSYGGYTDWYLPNRVELNLIWTNRISIPGIIINSPEWAAPNYYWSSTEHSELAAWAQNFSATFQSSQEPLFKLYSDYNVYVRCVRRYE